MGIHRINDLAKYTKNKHFLADESIKAKTYDIIVVSVKPPSTDYYCGESVNYEGEVSLAVCFADETAGSVESAADHVAYLNSLPLQRNEVGWTHTFIQVNFDLDVKKAVELSLPSKEAKWNKVQEDQNKAILELKEQQEIEQQTKYFNQSVAYLNRDDYSDNGWARKLAAFREVYPKARVEEIK